MEGPAIVVPMGRYSSFSKPARGRSPMCRSCGQSLLCLRVKQSRRRTSKICSESGGDGRLSSRGMCCREGGGQEGLRRSFKNDGLTRLVTGTVACAYGKAYEAAQRRDGLPSDAEALRAGPDRRLGGAHLLGEESSGGPRSHSDGRHGDSFSYRDGQGSVADESTWQGRAGREMARIAGKEGLHSAHDEQLSSTSGRFSNSRTVLKGRGDDEGEVFPQDRIPGRKAGIWDRGGGDQGVGRGKNLVGRQQASSIPSSELAKIEELRFSRDMREGDSGPQVLNLQRALFWLGHLRGLSLTGYFGPDTTRALREFHYSHGIPSTGVWGVHSQQVLWKHLHLEPHQKQSVGETLEKSPLAQKKILNYGLADTWLLVKNLSGKVRDNGLHASQALQQWQFNTRTELVASVSSIPRPDLDAGRVGRLFLIVVVLSIIAKVIHFSFGRGYGQPVKKRVMSWRNGADLQRPRKPTQTHPKVQQGQHKSNGGENILQYWQNHLGPKSTEQRGRGYNLLDRLVLFDGQVVRGDYPNNGKTIPRVRMDFGNLNKKSVEVRPTLERKSLPVLSSEQRHRSGSKAAPQKKTHGCDQFQKPEVDPPRKISSHNLSLAQSEKFLGPTGGEQLWSGNNNLHDVWRPGWASWLTYLFPLFTPNKEKLPSSPHKNPRRPVLRPNSSRQPKPPEEGVSDNSELCLRSSKMEGGSATDNVTQKWQEKNELELKKQVEELHRTVQSVEQTRVAAVRALAEEKMHNLELEVKIRRQKDAAAALEEEVRVLKDSHEALLATLKKKYSSSAAARAAAALLYQNWDPSDSSARV